MNKTLTSQIRKSFGLKTATSKRSRTQWELVLFMDVMDSHVRNGLDHRASEMLYGIRWSYRTGRLNAETEMKLRAMNAYQFAGLLADAVASCKVIGDVPQFLNTRII